ncbi:uncharacterized protein BJ171DRAFT_603246 [Polychytrium aggregatum]|uniref:uncharacterized protein n=1 Tax=Polychytrium aggregatum TaxID=110093 RepID=UPI0022FEFA93|nr:uncharacterized protein BJ171DRAFT_603246 [Polychytrium aggregatum]KAI9193505.1 hypothetical protein BJ171DRAFT_603246 [Polychytrium aggregatum]
MKFIMLICVSAAAFLAVARAAPFFDLSQLDSHGSSCAWPGHCEGKCAKKDDYCSWKGHCEGASCSSEHDCSDDLVCTKDKCAKPSWKSSAAVEGSTSDDSCGNNIPVSTYTECTYLRAELEKLFCQDGGSDHAVACMNAVDHSADQCVKAVDDHKTFCFPRHY